MMVSSNCINAKQNTTKRRRKKEEKNARLYFFITKVFTVFYTEKETKQCHLNENSTISYVFQCIDVKKEAKIFV